MADSQKRIAAAFLVGALLVAGSFIISRQSAAKAAQNALVLSSPVERTYIEVEDSNSDGVPNWQDALIKTDPIMVSDTSTSTYEKPKSITGKFAVRFFEDFLRSKTYGMFGDTNEELVSEAAQLLAAQAVDELFTEKDLSIFPLTDKGTLHAYGNQIALVILAHPNDGDSEAIILQDYMRYGDPMRLKDLEPIALAYTTIVKRLLETPVPKNYTKEHLDLVNALNAVRADVRAMQQVEEDPLYTLLRMKRYEDDVLGLSFALTNLYKKLYNMDNVEFAENDAAAALMSFTQ